MNIDKLDMERRQALINAAMKEFIRNGYDHASTNEIAKNAGMSKALMFHYVKSKEELFLFLMNYTSEKIQCEYDHMMNFGEPDIFARLRQSYLLQLKLLENHPYIFEFQQLDALTQSERINQKMATLVINDNPACFEKMFDSIDKSKFRKQLSIERCKELIYLSCIGFTKQIIDELNEIDGETLDCNAITGKIDTFFSDLQILFYKDTESERTQ